MHFIRLSHRTLLIHLLFWVLYCISNAFLWETFDKTYNEATYYGLTRLPLKIVAVYINFLLLGQFFFKKKYVAFFTFFLLNLFLTGFAQTYISTSGIYNYQLFTQYSLPICSVVLFSSIFIVIHQFFVQVNESKQLEIDKIKNELNFLKAQFQPHFLFNTLNNIYSLTFNNSQLAGKSILQLSGLLRYVLYESDSEKVDLQKEINHLKEYIELEKIRFASRMELSFNISGDTTDKKIIPILLIPFLENAFKHASNKLDEKIWITIDLIIKESNLSFTVENSVFPEGKTQVQHSYSGIGLENVKRRLSLLYKNHTLNHELRENYYHAYLMIPFN